MKNLPGEWQRSLLHTKLHVPQVRPETVARTRLLAQLGQAVKQQHRLVLLSAPPGFGKTTLVSEWVHRGMQAEPNPMQVGWFSLDPADNDPARFFLYLAAAFDNATNEQEEWQEIAHLLKGPQLPPVEMIVGSCFNVLARRATLSPLLIVLEDYHHIQTPELHRAISYWLDHAPPNLVLVITARADPPFPRARLRARGQLTEIRASDLRFREDEASNLLNGAMGLQLAPQQIDALGERTEGWVAGLQLAALALASDTNRDESHTRAFINAFTGSHNFVVDYLMEEVLAREEPALQNLLLQTSVLERLCAPLCEAILAPEMGPGSADTGTAAPVSLLHLQTLLEELERRNLFLLALDEQRVWFRYHHLFADVLRHRLHQLSPDRAAVLRERASIWFEGQGLYAEAVHYAVLAHAYERAVQLIAGQAEEMLRGGGHASLLSWLDALPAATLRGHPELGLYSASAHLITHQVTAAAHALEQAQAAIAELPDSERRSSLSSRLAGIGAMVALNRNDVAETIALGERALDGLDEDQAVLRGEVLLHMGVAYDWNGQLTRAELAFMESRQLGERAGDLATALLASANLGAAIKTHARYHDAAGIFRQGIQLEERANAAHLPATIYLYTDLSEILYEWGDLDGSEALIREAVRRCEQLGLTRALVTGKRLWARLLAARGRMEEAHSEIEQAVRLAAEHQLPHHYRSPARALQVQLWLRAGNPAAHGWAEQNKSGANAEIEKTREPESLALARVALARGEPAQANQLLKRVLADAEARERKESVIWILQLQALAYAAQQDSENAGRTLWRALTLSQPENFIRSYVDEGANMQALLVQAGQQTRETPRGFQEYLNRLRGSFPAGTGAPKEPEKPMETLTEREVQVLELVAQGLSDREAAAKLIVATGTVKRHLNNIYGKLGVSSRTQALARARTLGWIA